MIKKKAIIFDIDSTLVESSHIPPEQYHEIDWAAHNEAKIHNRCFPWAVEMCELYSKAGYCIVFLTARDDNMRTRTATLEMLRLNLSPELLDNSALVMRNDGDFRHDHLVKIEKYMDEIRPHYDVRLFVDDKASNCKVFRDIGIPSLCCSEAQ